MKIIDENMGYVGHDLEPPSKQRPKRLWSNGPFIEFQWVVTPTIKCGFISCPPVSITFCATSIWF